MGVRTTGNAPTNWRKLWIRCWGMSARQDDLLTAPLPFLLLGLVAGNAGRQEIALQTPSKVVTGLPSLFRICAQPSDFVRHHEYNRTSPACGTVAAGNAPRFRRSHHPGQHRGVIP